MHIAQLMTLALTVSCFSKIQTDFTFLVLGHLGSPGQRAVKWVCVYVAGIHTHSRLTAFVRNYPGGQRKHSLLGWNNSSSCNVDRLLSVCAESNAHCTHAQPGTRHPNSRVHCRPREDIWSLSCGRNHVHVGWRHLSL